MKGQQLDSNWIQRSHKGFLRSTRMTHTWTRADEMMSDGSEPHMFSSSTPVFFKPIFYCCRFFPIFFFATPPPTMRNAINFTWKDAFLKHKDAAELDRNTKILIKRIWRMGREMKTAQLDAIKNKCESEPTFTVIRYLQWMHPTPQCRIDLRLHKKNHSHSCTCGIRQHHKPSNNQWPWKSTSGNRVG